MITRTSGARRALLALAGTLMVVAGSAVTATTARSATCTTSASSGSCGPYLYPQITSSSGSNTYVNNEVWNPVPNASQTLTAADPGNWSAQANMPSGNTAVVSYPDTQQLYSNVPLTQYTSLTSAFTEALNPVSGTMAEAAYDLWLNNWATEVMVWVDNHGQSLGSDTKLGTATIAGQSWTIYRNGGPGSELIVSLNGSEQTGTVNLLAVFSYLQSQGWLASNSTLTAIDFGFEVSSTGGQAETFQLSCYAITENGTGGGTCGGSSSPPPPASAPTVTTGAASGVTSSGGTVNGTVNPNGQGTTYRFDYGTTTAYGSSVPSPPASAGSGTSAVSESQALTGLAASTTYHYRLEATNATGTSYGADHTFTTATPGTGAVTTSVSAHVTNGYPGFALRVLVLDNARETGGAAAAGQTRSGVAKATIVPAASRSLPLFALAGGSIAAPFRALAGSSFYDNVADSSDWWTFADGQYTGTVTAGTPVTVGSWAPGGQYQAWAAYEVTPMGSGTPTVDVASPAEVHNSGSSARTATFTAPAGSVIVALVEANGPGKGPHLGFSVSDSGRLAWTKRAASAVNNEGAAVYTTTVP